MVSEVVMLIGSFDDVAITISIEIQLELLQESAFIKNVVVDEIEEKDLEDMNKSELKEIAEELGLPKTGTKKQLIKKIELNNFY